MIRKGLAWFVGLLLAVILIGLVTKLIDISPTATDVAGRDVDAGWIAAMFAAIFGVALGNGSRRPARMLWALPVPRWKLALQIVAVDLAGATVVYACAYAIMLSVQGLAIPRGGASLSGTISVAGVLLALAMVYATYGWSALAGVLARRMPYAGLLAFPALMIWMILAQSEGAFGAILRAPIVANPFAVFNAGLALDTWTQHHVLLDPTAASLQWLGTTWAAPMLIAIAVATLRLRRRTVAPRRSSLNARAVECSDKKALDLGTFCLTALPERSRP